MLIITKAVPLITLVTNPVTGNVDMALSNEAIKMLGPLYPAVLRQNLEKALKVAEELERSTYYVQSEQHKESQNRREAP